MAARKQAPLSPAAGLEATLKALTGEKQPPEAVVALARGLAAAVEADPSNGALWREYRAALAEVMRADGDSDDGGAVTFTFEVSHPNVRAKVGDGA